MADVYKSAGIEAAKIAGMSSEMDSAAGRIAARARANAAGHGSLSSRIGVEKSRGPRGVVDREVVMEHPEAAFIEFGHVDRGGGWVKGLRVMRDAVEE